MLELLFLRTLVDLVLGSGKGRKSRVKIMVSQTDQAVRLSPTTSQSKDRALDEVNTIGEINGYGEENEADS